MNDEAETQVENEEVNEEKTEFTEEDYIEIHELDDNMKTLMGIPTEVEVKINAEKEERGEPPVELFFPDGDFKEGKEAANIVYNWYVYKEEF